MLGLKRRFWVLLFLALAACSHSPSQQPAQKKTITNRGSDTIVNMALAWAEAYSQIRPDIQISISGGGSGTGISSLINGTVDIANASRAMKPEEYEAARKNGVEPKEFIIARDAIAIIVHPDNPIKELTLQQLSEIFSGKILNWQELGGENRPMVRVSREVNSGTHIFFLEEVIRLGSKTDKTIFSADTLLLPSSEGITAEVGQNRNAIGYDGLGYVTNAVKMVAIASTLGDPYILPEVSTVKDGSYPISRALFMYTNGEPQGELKEYLGWIFSPAAQIIVMELGFIPN